MGLFAVLRGQNRSGLSQYAKMERNHPTPNSDKLSLKIFFEKAQFSEVNPYTAIIKFSGKYALAEPSNLRAKSSRPP